MCGLGLLGCLVLGVRIWWENFWMRGCVVGWGVVGVYRQNCCEDCFGWDGFAYRGRDGLSRVGLPHSSGG